MEKEKSLIGSVAQMVHDGTMDTLLDIVESYNTAKAKARGYSLVAIVYQQMLNDELESLRNSYGDEISKEIVNLVSQRLH